MRGCNIVVTVRDTIASHVDKYVNLPLTLEGPVDSGDMANLYTTALAVVTEFRAVTGARVIGWVIEFGYEVSGDVPEAGANLDTGIKLCFNPTSPYDKKRTFRIPAYQSALITNGNVDLTNAALQAFVTSLVTQGIILSQAPSVGAYVFANKAYVENP